MLYVAYGSASSSGTYKKQEDRYSMSGLCLEYNHKEDGCKIYSVFEFERDDELMGQGRCYNDKLDGQKNTIDQMDGEYEGDEKEEYPAYARISSSYDFSNQSTNDLGIKASKLVDSHEEMTSYIVHGCMLKGTYLRERSKLISSLSWDSQKATEKRGKKNWKNRIRNISRGARIIEPKNEISGWARISYGSFPHIMDDVMDFPDNTHDSTDDAAESHDTSDKASCIIESSKDTLLNKEVWLVGTVCDGHDGSFASEYSAFRFPEKLLEKISSINLDKKVKNEKKSSLINVECLNKISKTHERNESIIEYNQSNNTDGISKSLTLDNFTSIKMLDRALNNDLPLENVGLDNQVHQISKENVLFDIMNSAVSDIDKEIEINRDAKYSGCCLIASVITPNYLCTVSVGDCQAMIVEFLDSDIFSPSQISSHVTVCRTDLGFFMEGRFLNIPHRADNPLEVTRIETMKPGSLRQDRLLGIIQPTRSLGDWDIKHAAGKDLLIATPSVTAFKWRVPSLVITATDGIWDVMDRKSILMLILSYIKDKNITSNTKIPSFQSHTLSMMAQDLVSMSQKSEDDRTAIIIFVKPPAVELCKDRIKQH